MRPRVWQKKTDFLKLLISSSVALSEVNDFEELLAMITQTALSMANCEGCSIYEADGNQLRFIKTRNSVFETHGTQIPFKTFTIPIDDTTISGYVAHAKKVMNIEDVYNLPKDAPFSFRGSFDTLMNYRSKSMLGIPMVDLAGNVLGVLQLINRVENGNVVAFPHSVEPILRALASQFGIVLRNFRMAAALKQSHVETVKRFVKASECHDTDTGGHIERMSRYSVLLYRALGFNEQDCEVIRLASMLHDVGKISTPDAVLKKPGRLTPEEFEIMKLHTVSGFEMLKDADSPFLKMGAEIALSHHEKWDGSGYPKALKGTEIPLVGRVVAIADVFDALCSRRCYKDSWPIEKVLDEIWATSGTHFDPDIVQLFMNNLSKIYEIKDMFPPDVPQEIQLETIKSAS